MFWLLGLRILTPQAIDVKVKCYTNLLDSPNLSWQERGGDFCKNIRPLLLQICAREREDCTGAARRRRVVVFATGFLNLALARIIWLN